MRITSVDKRLLQLKRLHGEFPCDRSTRIWRLVIMAFCWLLTPALGVGALWEKIEEGLFLSPGINAVVSITTSLLLICFVLWFGYLGWLQKGHRYVISNGKIASIGRRTLWTVDLANICEIRAGQRGNSNIWWLVTPQGERGLILYRSLRAQLDRTD